MSPQFYPILMNVLAGIFGAFGQYAYKKGSQQLGSIPIYANYSLWAGMLLFCVVMVFFVVAYKMGGRMSVVYPFYATTFIWGALISHYMESEPINIHILGGTLLIVAGLAWIAQGAERIS